MLHFHFLLTQHTQTYMNTESSTQTQHKQYLPKCPSALFLNSSLLFHVFTKLHMLDMGFKQPNGVDYTLIVIGIFVAKTD